MAYSDFTTLRKTLDTFNLELQERSFFPEIPDIEPEETFRQYLHHTIPVASSGSEKVRSEGIIFPILVAAMQIQNKAGKPVSIFSGEDFTVDPASGLNGICDFIVCKSPLVSLIKSPVVTIVEAKKLDIPVGLGQCVAEMVAAQKFNERDGSAYHPVCGVTTTGTLWQYMILNNNVITLDIANYPVQPLAKTLGKLIWMFNVDLDAQP